jgi:Tol biopolymer transport system component
MMDIWTVRPDGTELRQLTATQDHNPYPVWSPDGKWIAVAGQMTLTLVDANGTQAEPVPNNMRATRVI